MAKRRFRWWLVTAAVAIVVAGAAIVAATTAGSRYPPVHFFTRVGESTGALCAAPGGAEIARWRFGTVRDPVIDGPHQFVGFSRETSVVRGWLARVGITADDTSFWAMRLREEWSGNALWTEWIRIERIDNGDFTPVADLAGTWRSADDGLPRVLELGVDGSLRHTPGEAVRGRWGARDDVVVLIWQFATKNECEEWGLLSEDRRSFQRFGIDDGTWARDP